jgi:hypothetical protein
MSWDAYHPDRPDQLANWFDVNNEDHLRAYREVSSTGVWPKWFFEMMKECGIVTHRHWNLVLADKLARAWLDHKLGKEEG